MLKKITLLILFLPLLAFSALYANPAYAEEHVKLILPEEERELWTKESVETNNDTVYCEMWIYQPSNNQTGKVILINTHKVDWSQFPEDPETIIEAIGDEEIKYMVKGVIATLGQGPSIDDEVDIDILYRTGSEFMAVGKYEYGVLLTRLMATSYGTHSIIFSNWGEECAQEKWVEVLKNAEALIAT